MAYKDPDVGGGRARPRTLREAHGRTPSQGTVPSVRFGPPMPGLSLCEPCTEKQHAFERARDAKHWAAGKARIYGRERSRRQSAERFLPRDCARNAGGNPWRPNIVSVRPVARSGARPS